MNAIGQNELGLHAAAGAVLRVVCDRVPQPMAVETAELSIRQISYIAVDPPTIPYRGDSRDADAEGLPRIVLREDRLDLKGTALISHLDISLPHG